MKRVITLMMLLAVITATAFAQPKSSDKALWKTAKKEAQKLEKDGWKVDGSLPLENLLYNHYQKLSNDDNNQELIANVVGNTTVKTLNQGQQWSTTIASVSYAKQAGQTVKGRIAAEVGAPKTCPLRILSMRDMRAKWRKRLKESSRRVLLFTKRRTTGLLIIRHTMS
jgi:hypothetical protein